MSNPVVAAFAEKKKSKADEYQGLIEDMLNSHYFEYANDFLFDILAQIERHGTITEKQMQAVENIRHKPRNL